jgi:hypothetical protein
VLWSWFGPRAVLTFTACLSAAATWQSVSGFGLSWRAGIMALITIGLTGLAFIPWRSRGAPEDHKQDKS